MKLFGGRIGARIRMQTILLGVLLLRMKYPNLGFLPSHTGNPAEERYLVALDAVPENGASDPVLLEICAGLGYGATLAPAWSGRYLGMDQSIVCAIATRLRGGNYLRADVMAMPLADHSVDHMIAVEGFVCLDDGVSGLREAFRVLKPGGTLTVVEFRLGEIEGVERYLRAMAAKAGCEIALFTDLTEQARASILGR